MQAKASINADVGVTVLGFADETITTSKEFVYLYHCKDSLAFFNKKYLKECTVYEDTEHNLVVNAGLDHICNLLLAASSATSFTHCAVGSNSTVVVATDTALNTQISTRKTIISRYLVSTGNANFYTFFEKADNAGTWLETGLFTAAAAGTMLARKIITSFAKTTSNAAVILWTITVTAS